MRVAVAVLLQVLTVLVAAVAVVLEETLLQDMAVLDLQIQAEVVAHKLVAAFLALAVQAS
jgi:hypothetical protein